jgi:hypothetical protein
VEAKEDCKTKICVETQNILSRKKILTKSSEMKHLMKEKHNLDLKNAFVCRVFRERLGMKYKPVKQIPFKGNSE